jgi:hypothetical protein
VVVVSLLLLHYHSFSSISTLILFLLLYLWIIDSKCNCINNQVIVAITCQINSLDLLLLICLLTTSVSPCWLVSLLIVLLFYLVVGHLCSVQHFIQSSTCLILWSPTIAKLLLLWIPCNNGQGLNDLIHRILLYKFGPSINATPHQYSPHLKGLNFPPLSVTKKPFLVY